MRPKYQFKVPIFAECISPDVFLGKSFEEIAKLKVFEGNRQRSLDEIFDVNKIAKNCNDKIIINLSGDFRKVRMIGYRMTSGMIVVEGDVGMRLGECMEGGEIFVKGNADSWVGSMMKGGKIEVLGSAGDYVGASYRGSTKGMANGTILIHKDAGNEVGCCMKGGLINVEGNVGEFAGVHMKDGTIIVRKNCSGRPGAGMLDGKIIICGQLPSVLPTFTIDCVKSDVKINEEKIVGPFYRFIGDIVENGKGKLFVAKSKNPHLAAYERYL